MHAGDLVAEMLVRYGVTNVRGLPVPGRLLIEAIADPTITEIQAGVYCFIEPELLVMDVPSSARPRCGAPSSDASPTRRA